MQNKAERYDRLYMDIALRCAEMSHAVRRKVGAVLVKEGRILSMGWNGMPAGLTNECEKRILYSEDVGDRKSFPMEEYRIDRFSDVLYRLETKPEVIHAEVNALAKVAKHGDSADGATLYVTLAPCVDCAKVIVQSGVKEVVFRETYKCTKGLQLLANCGLNVRKLD